jgi:MFS family permease
MAKTSDKPGKIGFYFFGLGEIFIGLLFVLMSAVPLIISQMAPANEQVPMPEMWPLSLVVLVFASFFMVMGVGTFMAKRWARKIMLILSWYGLSAGILGMLFFGFFMSSFMDNSLNPSGAITPAEVSGIKITMMAVTGIFYILLPGLFVFFYQSKKVLAAVEFYDPKENWMDACPTPVFAVSFFSALGVLMMSVFLLVIVGVNFSFASFGVPTWAVAAFLVAVIAALIYISLGFYHLEIKAWWAAVALLIIGGVATYFFYQTVDPVSMYQGMHIPQAQIDQMKKAGMLNFFQLMSNFGWLMMTPYLAYLLFVRKYFSKK